MQTIRKKPTLGATQDIEQLLTGASVEEYISKGSKTKRMSKRPPRRIRKSAALIKKVSKRAAYQPYLLDSQVKSVQTAQKDLLEFSQKNTDRKVHKRRGAKNWLSAFLANYMIFLILLACFWYVATQI